jgi:hypothetical protein
LGGLRSSTLTAADGGTPSTAQFQAGAASLQMSFSATGNLTNCRDHRPTVAALASANWYKLLHVSSLQDQQYHDKLDRRRE